MERDRKLTAPNKGHQLGTRRAENDLNVRADHKLQMTQYFSEQAQRKAGELDCKSDRQVPGCEPSAP